VYKCLIGKYSDINEGCQKVGAGAQFCLP
jgi:hypothetical protein